MPKMVSEITQGSTFEFSSDDTTTSSQDVRVFRVIKSSPSEYINLPQVCNAPIGGEHPRNTGLFCTNFSGAYEGESRMVILATFNYRTTPSQDSSGGGQDPKQSPPEVRPANWYTTSSLIEIPAQTWYWASSADGSPATVGTATQNPAGDLYEVVTKPTAIVTIHIDQFETSDPTKHCLHAGKTNELPVKLGSLNMARRTVMFRGVQSRPATESWGGNLYRGWTCSYEFLYKPNLVLYDSASSENDTTGVNKKLEYVGWDVLQPLSGFSVKAFDPDTARADQDSYGQPLKQDDDSKVVDDDLALPDGTAVGDKVRAMVKIGIRGGYTGQRPSAQPIPLNTDGTPRSETANPKVIVFRYKVTEEIDFLQTFNLRLF